MDELPEYVRLTLLHAAQVHVRRRLSEGLLDKQDGVLGGQSISLGAYFELARSAISRTFEILGPALVVDFIQQHQGLIDAETLEIWANIHDTNVRSKNDFG